MKSFKKHFFILFLIFFSSTQAETIIVNESQADDYLAPHLSLDSPQMPFSQPTTVESPNNFALENPNKNFRTGLLIAGFALGTTLYGALNWWDDSSSQFQVRHEGWFDADTPNGGADKLGHAYSFYVSTRVMRRGFEWAGHSRRKAAQWAGLTSAALSVGVEIMDGFTEEYGFSPEDIVMNLSGIGLGVVLEMYPQWDDLLDIRLHYWTSDDARQFDDYDPVADYSGQTYLLIFKASGMPYLRQHQWLRYFEFAMGYGSRGYQPNDGTEQPTERNLYYGLSLNLSQLLNDFVFKNKSTSTQQVTEQVLEYWQVPGTALLVKHPLD